MKKILVCLLAVIMAFSVVAVGTGCQAETPATSEGGETSASPEGGDGEKFVIGLSQEGLDHPYMVAQKDEILAEAEKAGNVEVICTDGQNQVVKQVAGIEDMLAKGIDLLMIQASQAEGLRQVLTKVEEQGVPYIFVGKPISGTNAKAIVSNDNRLIGQEIGQYIVDLLKEKYGSEKGNVVLIDGIAGDQTAEDRIGGCLDILEKYPDIKIVSRVPGEYRRPAAYDSMTDVLQANPKGTIDVTFACSGEMALGVVQACKDADRVGEFAVIGLDGQKEEFDAIKNGEETATWTYEHAGKEGFDVAMKILNGEEVEANIVIPSTRIDASNVDTEEPVF